MASDEVLRDIKFFSLKTLWTYYPTKDNHQGKKTTTPNQEHPDGKIQLDFTGVRLLKVLP